MPLKDKQLLEFTGHTGRYDVLMMDSFWVSEYVPKKVVVRARRLRQGPGEDPRLVRL